MLLFLAEPAWAKLQFVYTTPVVIETRQHWHCGQGSVQVSTRTQLSEKLAGSFEGLASYSLNLAYEHVSPLSLHEHTHTCMDLTLVAHVNRQAQMSPSFTV
jgi:hypothetical protein